MELLHDINSVLGGAVLPIFLLIGGALAAIRLRLFYIIHPIATLRRAFSGDSKGGTGAVRSTLLALAGTLGVGNIAGVATAINAGGAGAVFWMWIAALAAMGLKYIEVKLGVEHRRYINGEYRGGAHYYILDRAKSAVGSKAAVAISSVFALLTVCNSLLTGNIVQVSAAADVMDGSVPRVAIGVAFAILGMAVAAGRARRAANFSSVIVPVFSMIYIFLSIYIIARDITKVPSVFERIFTEALGLRAMLGGGVGFTVARAVRYGVTRGIFSNEAGMGTSPTAHAGSGTDDAEAQGCLGILEVFADTIALCTMTALVILLEGKTGESDGVSLAIEAYSRGAGAWSGKLIGISSIAFALASVVCQEIYGSAAIEYISDKKAARFMYIAASGAASVIGAVIKSELMWEIADALVALMCVINIKWTIFKKIE